MSLIKNIVMVVAGTNELSNTHYLAETMADAMKREHPNLSVQIIRLKEKNIQQFTLACYGSECVSDDCSLIQKMILSADGVILATPIWNFSVPAHLKNFIDCMGVFALDATHSVGTLHQKPFFLLFCGGAPKSAWPLLKRTTSHIGAAVQYFGGIVLGTHYEGSCTKGRGQFGLVVNERPASLNAVREKAMEFLRTIESVKETGVLPLRYRVRFWLIQKAQKIRRWMGM